MAQFVSKVEWTGADVLTRVEWIVNKALTAAAEVGAKEARGLVTKGTRWQSSNPGNAPNFQTGELAGSINALSPEQLGTPMRAAYGTSVPHGKYMEFGAVIRGKSPGGTLVAGKLPVPVNVQARQMLARIRGASLRTQRLMAVHRNKKVFLMEKTPGGKLKKNGAVFVLKSEVRIAPRPWLVPSSKLAAGDMLAKFKDVCEMELTF